MPQQSFEAESDTSSLDLNVSSGEESGSDSENENEESRPDLENENKESELDLENRNEENDSKSSNFEELQLESESSDSENGVSLPED